MHTLTVRGMVISSMPMGEYDRRLEILTDSVGRISAFARGARKPSSALVSASRVFAFGEFDLYEGKSAYSVQNARISNYFEELSADMEKNLYGFYFLEFAAFFTREGLDATLTLKLLYQSLRALSVKSLSHELVKLIFDLKMLEINGICPPVSDIEKQGDCLPATLYAIDFVKRTPIEKLFSFTLSEEVKRQFGEKVTSLVQKAVDKKFKSLELLNELGQMPQP